MHRRDFLKSAAGGIAWLAAPTGLTGAESVTTHALRAAAGETSLAPSLKLNTSVWQYNRQTPGPVIRVKQGSKLRIPFSNGLEQATSVHWHGLRIPNRMDGVPGITQEAIEPGGEFLYEFAPPDAGTFWYHTHNRSWEQLARGLYGALIVEESDPIKVDRDLVWVIDDWLIGENGAIDESSLGELHDWAHAGRLGNLLTVNGKARPEFPAVAGERIRLRLINVANARTMNLRFPGVVPQVIAVDGQPVDPFPLVKGELLLASGQRVDLIVDAVLDPGERIRLEFFAGERYLTAASLLLDSDRVLRRNPLDAPIRLPDNPLPGPLRLDSAHRLDLKLEGGAMGRLREAELNGKLMPIRELIQHRKVWALNGIAGLPEAPLFRVQRGRSVVIRLINDNRWPHAMHLHGHHFRNINAGDGMDAAWRDTVLLEGGDEINMAFVADNPGKWLIHCHMIEHQAGGMVTWFEVV